MLHIALIFIATPESICHSTVVRSLHRTKTGFAYSFVRSELPIVDETRFRAPGEEYDRPAGCTIHVRVRGERERRREPRRSVGRRGAEH